MPIPPPHVMHTKKTRPISGLMMSVSPNMLTDLPPSLLHTRVAEQLFAQTSAECSLKSKDADEMKLPSSMLLADTHAITGHWNNITAFVLPSNTTLLDTAELFAKLAVSYYDSNIQGWFIKCACIDSFCCLLMQQAFVLRYYPIHSRCSDSIN